MKDIVITYDIGNYRLEFSVVKFVAFVFGFLIAFYFLGCTTTQNIPLEKRQKTYLASKTELVDATVDAFTSNGYMLAELDRSSGFVSTKYKTDAMKKQLQAIVDSVGNGRSRIRLTIDYRYLGGGCCSSVGMKSSNLEYYRHWFKEIEQEI